MKRKKEHRGIRKHAAVFYLFSLLFSCLLFMQSKTVFNNNQLEKLMFHFPQLVFAERTQVRSTVNLYNMEPFKALQPTLFKFCEQEQIPLIFQFMEEKRQSDGRQEQAYYIFAPLKDRLIDTLKEPVKKDWDRLDASGELALLPDERYALSVPVLDENSRGQYGQEIQYSFHGMGGLEARLAELTPGSGAVIWTYPQASLAPKIQELFGALAMPSETMLIPPEARRQSSQMTNAFAPTLALGMLALMLILMISAAIQKELYTLSVHLLHGQSPLRLMLKMFARRFALSLFFVMLAQCLLALYFVRGRSLLARQFFLVLLKYDLALAALYTLLLLLGALFLSKLPVLAALKHRFSPHSFVLLGHACKFLCVLLACCYCLGNWEQISEHLSILRELEHQAPKQDTMSLLSQYEVMGREFPAELLPFREQFLLLGRTQGAYYFDSSQILTAEALDFLCVTEDDRAAYEQNKVLIVNQAYLEQSDFKLSLDTEQEALLNEQKKPLLLRPGSTPIPENYKKFTLVDLPANTEIYSPRLEAIRDSCILLLPQGGDYPYKLSCFYLPDNAPNRAALSALVDEANALVAQDLSQQFVDPTDESKQCFYIQTLSGLDIPAVHNLVVNELVLNFFYFILWALLLAIVVWHNAQSYFAAHAKRIGILHLQGSRWWRIYRPLLEASLLAYPLLYFLLRYWSWLRVQLVKLSLSYMFSPNDLKTREILLFFVAVALAEAGLFFYHMRRLERQSICYVKGMDV